MSPVGLTNDPNDRPLAPASLANDRLNPPPSREVPLRPGSAHLAYLTCTRAPVSHLSLKSADRLFMWLWHPTQ
jgi:hypothetical protein